jgi:hypothetical protein
MSVVFHSIARKQRGEKPVRRTRARRGTSNKTTRKKQETEKENNKSKKVTKE